MIGRVRRAWVASRMRRHLVNLLVVLSLLLCVAACVLWWGGTDPDVGSGDEFVFTTGGRLWWVMSRWSQLHVVTVGEWPGAEPLRWATTDGYVSGPMLIFAGTGTSWHRLGVSVQRDTVKTWLSPDGRPLPFATYLAELVPRGGTRESAPMPYAAVHVPWWMVVVLFGVLPSWRGASSFRRDRRRRGRAIRNGCLACGYDLTGNVSGVCPECGTGVR
jgi:hypothetical protein